MISAGDANHPVLEETATLFQPDSLLPVQYFENFQRKIQTEPEKRLMLAVLDEAVACFQKHFMSRGGRGLRLFRETEEWIFRGDSAQPFSFANICEVVGFDPQYVRQGLLKWRERKIAELAKIGFQPEPNAKKPRAKTPEASQRRPEVRTDMIGIGV